MSDKNLTKLCQVAKEEGLSNQEINYVCIQYGEIKAINQDMAFEETLEYIQTRSKKEVIHNETSYG